MSPTVSYLIHCLSEEAGEVSQIVGKINRFGLHDVKEGSAVHNATRLQGEVHDLLAVYNELYLALHGKEFVPDPALVRSKLQRLYYYMFYSVLVETFQFPDLGSVRRALSFVDDTETTKALLAILDTKGYGGYDDCVRVIQNDPRYLTLYPHVYDYFVSFDTGHV